MDTNWAAQNLQVIRTLMERTAIYRRALAPVMITLGLIGSLAGGLGWGLELDSTRRFGLFWTAVCGVALTSALLLVRRQALRDAEPFWSLPTRRVSQAVLPPLAAGAVTVAALFLPRWQDSLQAWWLPPLWMILYGCALHAAAFFMPRGMKLFGWLFILAGSGLFLGLSTLGGVPPMRLAHAIMGVAFGGLHLVYGIYLYWTERANPAA